MESVKGLYDVKKILVGEDYKIMMAIGPCAIIDFNSCKRLVSMVSRFMERFSRLVVVIFRAYFEKPRTTNGWKGLIMDPLINGSYNLGYGVKLATEIITMVKKNGLLIITEILNENVAKIIGKIVDIGTIGARTCGSQCHRELASFLGLPFGVKNDIHGCAVAAINTLKVLKEGTVFIDKNDDKLKMVKNKGNNNVFLILRGGGKPNYKVKQYKKMIKIMDWHRLYTGVLIDCSHGNSNKNYSNQKIVVSHIAKNLMKYERLTGIMLEVNVKQGFQGISKKINKCISVTDGCIDIKECYQLIKYIYRVVMSERF